MNWNSISIKQGQAICDANDEVAAGKSTELDRDILILSVIYGKPVDHYESIPLERLRKMIKKTAWVNKMPDAHQNKPFRHGNYFYKFRVHPGQLSQSDFALLQKFGQSHPKDLHKVLAILSTKFRIITPKECKMDFEERAELFLNKMPFGIAYSYCLFFSTYYPSLLRVGLAYSQGIQEAAQQHQSKTQ